MSETVVHVAITTQEACEVESRNYMFTTRLLKITMSIRYWVTPPLSHLNGSNPTASSHDTK